jgi:hypothetical protein
LLAKCSNTTQYLLTNFTLKYPQPILGPPNNMVLAMPKNI